MTSPDRLFWRHHLLWPLLGFVLVFAGLEAFSLDRPIADALFHDAGTGHWLGTGPGDWWAHFALHTVGRWAVRVFAFAAIVLWIGSFRWQALRPWRRALGYTALAYLLAVLLVGGLKSVTNVDCPWDLAGYGGQNPYVALFADRPDALPRAKCFPGAHASSGFALLCAYFALRDRAPRAARRALWVALIVGVAFSIGQEARGAHFLSHDLTSAALVWFVQLALYAWMLKPRGTPG